MLTQDEKHVALRYYEALDTPVSLGCFMQLTAGDYSSLIRRSVSPRSYSSSEDYLRDCAAISFLKKLETTFPGENPGSAALTTWLEGEAQCFRTNRRLSDDFDEISFYGKPLDHRMDNFVRRARSIVTRLIGTDPGMPLGRLGPGATMSDPYGSTDVINKFTSDPTLSDHSLGLLSIWKDAWARSFSDSSRKIQLVRSNRFFTVPKTALTDRPCAKEPSLNAYFQLGLGGILRRRLRACGIDLVRSQELHRALARSASIDGSQATIDLSSASDTLSHGTVKLLLPERWVAALEQCRSARTDVSGRTYLLEKFSSMGNGFTFELETVVFFAIACSVSEELLPGVNVHVYGDDIIIPSSHARDVIAALRYYGFTTNKSKSFVDGPFRESCGGDFFSGSDVRPIYLKRGLNEPQDYITLHNQLYRFAHRLGGELGTRVMGICDDLRSSVPVAIRQCLGPQGLGDICFHAPEDRWRFTWRDCIRYIRTYVPLPTLRRRFDTFSSWAQSAAALYGITLHRDRVIGSGVGGYRIKWTPWS